MAKLEDIERESDINVMREQFSYLLIHHELCGSQLCAPPRVNCILCSRFARIKALLMSPFARPDHEQLSSLRIQKMVE
jgi:hypothetical protein